MRYTFEARRQVEVLAAHYEEIDRPEAIRNLQRALVEAEARIVADPTNGLAAPRPYPDLRLAGRSWLKAGAYWIAYASAGTPTIMGVFYERADIPGRIGRGSRPLT